MTFGVVILILTVGFGTPILIQKHIIQQRQHCLFNLIQIDHILNCLAAVEQKLPPGTQVDTGWIVTNAYLFRASVNCPSGQPYATNLFRVGSHPVCARHGDLISQVGYVPHEQPEMKRELRVERIRPWMVCCFGLTLFSAGLVLLKRKR